MNSVTLIGRLTKDPQTNQARTASRFNLAVNREYKTEGGPEADFISCVAFGKTAEVIDKYLSKGQQVGVAGRIQTGSYEKEGEKVYTTDVVVNRVEFLGRPKGQESGGQSAPTDGGAAQVESAMEEVADDIPF